MSMTEQMIYYNGKLLKESEACLSPFNRGFSFGDGVFETFRVYSGKLFRLENHIKRLFEGLDQLGIERDADSALIENAVQGLINKNSLNDASIKITAFREESPGLDPAPGLKACYLITSSSFDLKRKKKCEKGISACIVAVRRNQSSPHVFIKSLNYLENIFGRREAQEKGYDEAIFLNILGHVAEGSISNIFVVKDSILFTPSLETGILNGVTRDVVIEIVADLGIECCEKLLKKDDLLMADEVFMTNSLMEIIPVREINGQMFGDRCPGEMTYDLIRRYTEKVYKELAVSQ